MVFILGTGYLDLSVLRSVYRLRCAVSVLVIGCPYFNLQIILQNEKVRDENEEKGKNFFTLNCDF